MKPLICFLLIISYAQALEFTTTDGDHYSGEIKRVEPDGIVLATSDGISKVKFKKLPAEMAAKYGYDPAKEAAYQLELKALIKAQADAIAKAQADKEEQIAAIKLRADNQKLKQAQEASALAIQQAKDLDEFEKNKARDRDSRIIHYTIEEVRKDGAIVDDMRPVESSYSSSSAGRAMGNGQSYAGVNMAAIDKLMEPVWQRSGNLIFISSAQGGAEGDVKQVSAIRQGEVTITDRGGMTRTLAKWTPLRFTPQ